MAENYKSYRIRTNVGQDSPNVINVQLDQTYDAFEILSLKIDSDNAYNLFQSDKGIIVGRVLANGGFGVPNAKISIFIPTDDTMDMEKHILYPYSSVNDTNNDRIRYNLLPDEKDEACYQNVGTFPNKRYVLDNDDVIEVFDRFWKYTTVTNSAGDYMMYGIPTGSQTLHADIDLSDIGLLSQRPRDMVYKGFNINQFESPNKFKQDTNLNSLAQIKTQDVGVFVYPFWGDSTDNPENIAVTRCDIQVDYKFEPTCVFIGSIITDTGSNAIGKNCAGTDEVGKMSDLVAGEGSIEMIRKTFDGKVEQFQIKGNRVIDGDGVWCYQIPMNLDYVMTDEYGNLVPSDNPDKGIPTRARVRFRISLDDAISDSTARKRCKYLVPNNPRMDEERFPEFYKSHEADYEFGSNTKEESYCDLFWNKVYSVKNYIPRIQKNTKITNRKHTGIKLINHYGDNNPMPYNNLSLKLSFTYRFICVLTKIFILLVTFLNGIITLLGAIPCILYTLFQKFANLFYKMRIRIRAFGKTLIDVCLGCPIGDLIQGFADLFHAIIPSCIAISSDFCAGDVTHAYTYYPGCGKIIGLNIDFLSCTWEVTEERHNEEQAELDNPEDRTTAQNENAELYNCVESELAESNDATSFNFQNDWINGSLYAPLWFRKITPKKKFLFGAVTRKAKDEWCSSDHVYTNSLRLYYPCAVNRNGTQSYTNHNGEPETARYMNSDTGCGDDCHTNYTPVGLNNGLILTRQTMLGQTVYYYKAVEYDASIKDVKLLFASDIILLGSLNDCDLNGVPQFFKSLESSTYKLPSNMLFTDNEIKISFGPDGKEVKGVDQVSHTEMTGNDWGNSNDDMCNGDDGGLFYDIGCSSIEFEPKSCINLSRICEFGVSLDEAKQVPNLEVLQTDETGNSSFSTLIPDGFISKDELYNDDWRSMFATMNGNELKTKLNKENGLKEYDFRYLYVDNFDNSLQSEMRNSQRNCGDYTYRNNYKLEMFSPGYYDFRMGKKPYFYDAFDGGNGTFPRYENSFYFYFGLKVGKTALDKFNSQFFSECNNANSTEDVVKIVSKGNTWCSEVNDSYTDEEPHDGIITPSEMTGMRDNDGYVKFDLTNVSLPCDIDIINLDNAIYSYPTIEQNAYEKIVIGNKWFNDIATSSEKNGYTLISTIPEYSSFVSLKNGSYKAVITDNDGNIMDFRFNMSSDFLTFKTEATPFRQPDNVLNDMFNGNMVSIACDNTGINCNEFSRLIGGTILISDIIDNTTNTSLEEYIITVDSEKEIGYSIESSKFHFSCNNSSSITGPLLCKENGSFLIGVPKSDENYIVKVRQLCNGVETQNASTQYVKVKSATPFKMYINDVIDYDVISHWTTGWKADTRRKITSDGTVSPNWYSIGDNHDYKWQNYSNMKDNIEALGKKLSERASLIDSLNRRLNFATLPTVYQPKLYTNIWTDMLCNISVYPSEEVTLNGNYTIVTGETINFRKYTTLTDDDIIAEIKNEQRSIKYDAQLGPDDDGDDTTPSYTIDYVNNLIKDKDAIIRDINERVGDNPNTHVLSTLVETCGINQLNEQINSANRRIEEIKAKDKITQQERAQIPIIESYIYYWGLAINVLQNQISEIEGNKDNFQDIITDLIEWIDYDNDIIDNFKAIKEQQLEFVDAMRSTFQLTCPNDSKTIRVKGITDDTPVEFISAFRGEESLTTEIRNTLEKQITNGNVGIFDNITIPSLTYKESEKYGNTDYPITGTDYCFGTDNRADFVENKVTGGQDQVKPIKYSYFIGIKNKAEKTIPAVLDFNNIKNLFGFHIVDKIFDMDYAAWSTFIDMPYFGIRKDDDYKQKRETPIRASGIFASKILNGYVTKKDENGITTFQKQRYGNGGIKIYTPLNADNSEEKLPTRRYILGDEYTIDTSTISTMTSDILIVVENILDGIGIDYKDSELDEYIKRLLRKMPPSANRDEYADNIIRKFLPFDNYQITNVENGKWDGTDHDKYVHQYLTVPNRNNAIKITDKNACSNSITVYGSMKIVLDEEESYHDIRYINVDKMYDMGRLVINLEGSSGKGVTYYVMNCENNEKHNISPTGAYPLNYFKKQEFQIVAGGQTIATCYQFDEPISENSPLFESNNTNAKYLFAPNTTKQVLQNECDNGIPSESVDANGRKVRTMGYGTTGEFEMNQRTRDYSDYSHRLTNFDGKKVYFVAVTENNCKCISPVYDFAEIEGELQVVAVSFIRHNENNEAIREAITQARVRIKNMDAVTPMQGNAERHKLYYLNNFSFTMSLVYTDGVNEAVMGSSIVEKGTTDFVYFDLTGEQYLAMYNEDFWPFVEIKDYTNLRHRISVENLGATMLCQMTWKTNGGYWCIEPSTDTSFKSEDIYWRVTPIQYSNPEEKGDTDDRKLFYTYSDSTTELQPVYLVNYNVDGNNYWPNSANAILKKKKENEDGFYQFVGWAEDPNGDVIHTTNEQIDLNGISNRVPKTYYAIWE